MLYLVNAAFFCLSTFKKKWKNRSLRRNAEEVIVAINRLLV